MTEQEKKAIKKIDIIAKECELYFEELGYECNLYDGDEPIPVKEYRTLLNLIEKQQKDIEDKDKQIYKLSLIRQETEYGYENFYIMTEDRLVTIELNKFIVEIANGEFVDIRKLYDDYKNSIPKKALREIIERNQRAISDSNDGNLIHDLRRENKILKEILGE